MLTIFLQWSFHNYISKGKLLLICKCVSFSALSNDIGKALAITVLTLLLLCNLLNCAFTQHVFRSVCCYSVTKCCIYSLLELLH